MRHQLRSDRPDRAVWGDWQPAACTSMYTSVPSMLSKEWVLARGTRFELTPALSSVQALSSLHIYMHFRVQRV